MSHFHQDEDLKSLKCRSDCLPKAGSAESKRKRPRLQRKSSSHESCIESPKQVYLSPEKLQLNCRQSSANVNTHPLKGYEVGESSLSNSTPANSEPNVLSKSSSDLEQMLRQIIRTAYQFTRHSHREKLLAKDLEKAFKVHQVDMSPDDVY